ncbi:hypothetical protein SteCoe_4760 [Stentor coeruleus]|uniref:Major facilitator superfamily (MFS) profile domain-containing protein n=1 Tax=Stentor coeruleus TaxID=5963 RepID=A0A1R2CTS9_9CILI|nr:hypothetical protein SteCoe_4760 [Stentor coeruleus]
MSDITRQLAIYMSLVICCAPYSMIANFYPNIAHNKGLQAWVIGAVFSANPAAGLITALFLKKYMVKIGRKTTILASVGFSGLSMLVLCPIEHVGIVWLFIFSFLSSILAGIGAACIMTASDTVFISDYPDKVDVMIGRVEAAIGLGLIIGPLLGAILVMGSLLLELIICGLFIILLIPLFSKMLGTFRDYEVKNKKNSLGIINKPRIALDLGMNLTFQFSISFVIPSLELHLLEFELPNYLISLCFILLSASYTFFCLFGTRIFRMLEDRTSIFLGAIVLGFSYLMLAPWDVVFPNKLWIVLLSLPIIGFGQAMIYLPTFPHMIRSAHEDYGLAKDDILSDSIAGLSNISFSIGEIIGPLFAGILIDLIGYQNTTSLTALLFVGYGIIYLFGSGLFSRWISKKHYKVSLISPEVEDNTSVNI